MGRILIYPEFGQVLKSFIVKTAVKTAIIALLILSLLVVGINFLFPQHMATFCEQSGNYSLATKYASLRYSYTKNTDDLSRAVDDSILAKDDALIIEYGDQFILCDDFFPVCNNKSAQLSSFNYAQFVCGRIAIAKYNSGDFTGAQKVALFVNGTRSFESNNAFMTLGVKIIGNKDTASARVLLDVLKYIEPERADEVDNLNTLIKQLTLLG